MPLTNTQLKSAKLHTRNYKLSDSGGLYALVTPKGAKYWRIKYRFAGKEKLLSLGVYPDVTLSEARRRKEDARRLLSQRIDPSAYKAESKRKQAEAASNSFEDVAQEWLAKRGPKSEGGDKRLNRLLQKDLYPILGSRPINEISPPDLLDALRVIEKRGAINTAHRAKQAAAIRNLRTF